MKEKRNEEKKVAIVVPVYRTRLTIEEQISMRHLTHFLGAFDKYLILPETLDFSIDGFQTKRFADKFFASVDSYSALMLWKDFYTAFDDYEYILIYQLDALVFSGALDEWCAANWDYVGAPFMRCEDSPLVTIEGGGNGGFSLRKVESFLRVLTAPTYRVEAIEKWDIFNRHQPRYKQELNRLIKAAKRVRTFNQPRRPGMKWYLGREAEYRFNEDLFWSFEAAKHYPQFAIPTVRESLRFSFEVAPRKCFEINGNRLPFGCHAWCKYDRAFWQPYLVT